MVDKEEHEKWKTEEKEIILFMKEKKEEFRSYQEDLFDELWSEPDMKSCSFFQDYMAKSMGPNGRWGTINKRFSHTSINLQNL